MALSFIDIVVNQYYSFGGFANELRGYKISIKNLSFEENSLLRRNRCAYKEVYIFANCCNLTILFQKTTIESIAHLNQSLVERISS